MPTTNRSSHTTHLTMLMTILHLTLFTTLTDRSASGGCVNDSEAELTNAASLQGAAVLFQRGSCSFSAMVRAATAADAKAVYVLNVYNRTDVEPGVMNESDYSDFHGPVCMLSVSAGALVNGTAPSALTAAVYDPSYPVLDPACAVFVAIAVGVLISGSMWNTQNERARAARCRAGRGAASGSTDEDDEPEERGEEQQLLTKGTIVFFLVFASVFLTLLYFFYK
jgi:hypothetical protein